MPASPNATSRRMARTVGKDNPRERALRSALHRQRIRFRIHYVAIPGTRRSIDIAFTRLRLAVFCDGCFWHGCPAHATIPKTHREWWVEKIMANKIRDRDTDARLINSGWTVMRIPVAFGSCSVEAWQAMNFASRNEWWDWCRQDPDIASRSSFALADLYDFALGINEAEHASPEAATLWHMAQSNLQDISNALPAAFHVDSVIQPICLVAELAMKGTLVWHGVDPNDFRGPAGHDLKGLAKRLAKARPHRDDAAVREVIVKLPPYVQSRYSPQGLTRLDVVRLAMGVQFIAGSMLRRITHVDFAAQMDSGEWPAPRRPFFPTQN
ncbi:DNA mismatch endonuclease Vsr [Burkholderia pseudomallei]|nr:DNA mismatch endonuclease Vsr [Burkholderia pseudomallei]